ncbi:MAG TPA: pyruvate kinase alpha/beta domain-containing protein, partial [Methanothrix sp.]|nr:pyruvate kinase alpha/beta domain-containing protein [Methanothrix sp.]
MEGRIVYFEDGGAQNTQATLGLVRDRLGGKDIKKIVLASTTGETARRAMEFFRDQEVTLVVVPHQFDFHREKNAFPPALVEELRRSGHQVHFGTMLFHTDEFYGSKNATALANILRAFCQGVKVCFEIVYMAADAGLVAGGEKVIAIAGTGRGSDTALVMQAASTQHPHRLKVHEILCK